MTIKFFAPGSSNGTPLAWIDGIPARDLTQAEWDALPPEKREEAIASGLYRVAETKKSVKQTEE